MQEDVNQEMHKYNNRILMRESIQTLGSQLSHLLLLRCPREVEEEKETFDRTEMN